LKELDVSSLKVNGKPIEEHLTLSATDPNENVTVEI